MALNPSTLSGITASKRASTVDKIVKGVQPIAFENASWAYTLGVGIALK